MYCTARDTSPTSRGESSYLICLFNCQHPNLYTPSIGYMVEMALKELNKLERLTANSSPKGKSPSVTDSLDSLLQSLNEAKGHIQEGSMSIDTFEQLAQTMEARKKEVDDRQKEIYGSLSRFGKALDKVCTSVNKSAGVDCDNRF
jgi:chromosome segregation ATPase